MARMPNLKAPDQLKSRAKTCSRELLSKALSGDFSAEEPFERVSDWLEWTQ